jgi:hypothetical protein
MSSLKYGREIFKRLLSKLVENKLDSVLEMACEELYRAHDEPLLLSIIPNLSAEFGLLMSSKMVKL